MDREPCALEIRLHLIDSRVVRYAVWDPFEARRIMDQLKPDKLYEQAQIVIGGAEGVNAFQSALVSRIDMLSETPPDWPYHHNVRIVQEVSEIDYRELTATNLIEGQPLGDVVRAFAEMEMSNGELLFFWMDINSDPAISPLTPLDHHVFLQQLFSSGGLHARLREEGVMLINPAHIARLTMVPGPGIAPKGAWRADAIQPEVEIAGAGI